MNSKLVVEIGEVAEKFVDVFFEDTDTEILVTVRSVSTEGFGSELHALLLEISVPTPGDEDVEDRITIAAENWEDVKRMGDAAIAAFREKFAGPS